jgi:hypothetical protein
VSRLSRLSFCPVCPAEVWDKMQTVENRTLILEHPVRGRLWNRQCGSLVWHKVRTNVSQRATALPAVRPRRAGQYRQCSSIFKDQGSAEPARSGPVSIARLCPCVQHTGHACNAANSPFSGGLARQGLGPSLYKKARAGLINDDVTATIARSEGQSFHLVY